MISAARNGDGDAVSQMPRTVCLEKRKEEGESSARGVFVPLKTTLEVRSREETVMVYGTWVPVKLASTVLG